MNTELIHTVTTWLHYVGGHYDSPEKFIREAQRLGITRRCPPQVALGMDYGDRVILLRYGGKGKVFAFAEFTIDRLTLDGDLAQKVGEKFKAEGKATYSEGGGCVERECGSFFILGTWQVEAAMAEVVRAAMEIAEGEGKPVSVMIGGTLSRVYDAPVLLQPAPNFTRGFIRADEMASFEFFGNATDTPRQIVAIENYMQARR